MKIISEKESRSVIHHAAKHGKLTFLVGAGISKIAPSNLPLGNDIKDLLIRMITKDSTLRHHRKKILSLKNYKELIPELIFQPLYETLGDKMYKAYSILDKDQFNHVHQVIGWFGNTSHSKIYTTNFDTLIEKSVLRPLKIEHLHGALDKPDEMIIRIYQVGRGIRKSIADRFKKENKGRTLCVLGYSGNDKDIIALLNTTMFKQIIWMVLDEKDAWTLSRIGRITKHEVDLFKADLNSYFLKTIKSLYIRHSKALAKLPFAAPGRKIRVDITYVEALRCIQSVYYVTGNYNDAIAVCDLALKKHRRVLTPEDKSWFLQISADNLVCIGNDFRKAVNQMKAAIRINSNTGNQYELAESYNALGNVYVQRRRSDSDTAINYLTEAMNKALQLPKTKLTAMQRDQLNVLLGKIYNNMGLALDNLKDHKNAIENYKTSIKYKKRAGNITAIAITEANISLAFLSLGSPRYLRHMVNAEEIFLDYGAHYRLGYLYRELGTRIDPSKKDIAEDYIRKAIATYANVPNAEMDIELCNRSLQKILCARP